MVLIIATNSKIINSIQLIILIVAGIIYIISDFFKPIRNFLQHGYDIEQAKEEDRNLSKDSLCTSELINRVTTVSNFEDFIANSCTTYYEEDSCIVCLCRFQGKDEIRQLSTCCHIFHRSCLDRWIHDDQVICPLCRTPFLDVKKKSSVLPYVEL
ncbi:hypothetical protein MKW92_023703 [Papaver armeniacum]|nr:hypothetical protein MKW92_023703 [Papaver armeniacum]